MSSKTTQDSYYTQRYGYCLRLSNNNHKTSCQQPVVHERLAGDHAMPFWSATAVSR